MNLDPFDNLMPKTDCEKRITTDYPRLYSLLGMSWWDENSPLRKWISFSDKGYDVPLRLLENELSTVQRLFPKEFVTWRGHLGNPHHFWSKIFEAKCINLLDSANIHIVALEQDHGTGRNPDLELDIDGSLVTIECTSLHYDPDMEQNFIHGMERDEQFRLRFGNIRRPYYISLNWMPNLADPAVTELFFSFFEEWFTSHQDGEEAVIKAIPGFERIRLTPALPIARIHYVKELSFVSVGGVAPFRVVDGPPNTLRNRFNDKRKQIMHQPSDANIIAIDISFRSDLLLSKVAPFELTTEKSPAIDELFAKRNTDHVHAIHMSQLNILETLPITPMSWENKHAKECDPLILRKVLQALNGEHLTKR